MDITFVLLAISLILFFGIFAEFIFKKTGIPDILLLIILGFILGPGILGYIAPESISMFAPFFTTFALLFITYDGSFNIDLASFAKGLSKSLKITLFNFSISSIAIFIISLLFGLRWELSLLIGLALGGISSEFVIPLMKRMKLSGETVSILTLEAVITDVLSIVLALTLINVITLKTFGAGLAIKSITSLFAIAGLIGIFAGIVWIIIVVKFLKNNRSYMINLAYVIMIYVITELLGGNGLIAVLFLGLILKNSRQLTATLNRIVNKEDDVEDNIKSKKSLKKVNSSYPIISVTSDEEKFFYSQISFFLKTFFFVYVGVLFNIQDTLAVVLGIIVSVVLIFTRGLSKHLTKEFPKFDTSIISSTFARGIVAVAIAQVMIQNLIENASMVANIIYSVIIFSIIVSSIKIFLSVKKGGTSNYN